MAMPIKLHNTEENNKWKYDYINEIYKGWSSK
jgi:hypothetical protein